MAVRFAAIEKNPDGSHVVYLVDAKDIIPRRVWRGEGPYSEAKDYIKSLKPPAKLVPVGVLRSILTVRRGRRE